MRILVIGCNGQVGFELLRTLQSLGDVRGVRDRAGDAAVRAGDEGPAAAGMISTKQAFTTTARRHDEKASEIHFLRRVVVLLW